MDKVISARLDESAVDRVGELARRLRTSKKSILERAIAMYADHVDQGKKTDVFEQTCGAWSRKEPPEQLVKAARKAFHNSMRRRQQ